MTLFVAGLSPPHVTIAARAAFGSKWTRARGPARSKSPDEVETNDALDGSSGESNRGSPSESTGCMRSLEASAMPYGSGLNRRRTRPQSARRTASDAAKHGLDVASAPCMDPQRRPLLVANWKMHFTLREAQAQARRFRAAVAGLEHVDLVV